MVWAEEERCGAARAGKILTYVVAREVVDRSLGQHAVVLELRLAERGSVASNDNELGLAGAEGLEGRLVTKSDYEAKLLALLIILFPLSWRRQLTLARLHNKRQLGVDAVRVLLAFLNGSHLDG